MRCEFHCDRSPCDGANLYNGVMLDGTIHPDYADVASTLIRQIPRDRHGGSAVCVYHRGRSVVDIWGGAKNGAGEPWARDTTAPSFSTTKGVLSTLLHILVDRGKAGYDDPIAAHRGAHLAELPDRPPESLRPVDGETIKTLVIRDLGRQPAADELDETGHVRGLRALGARLPEGFGHFVSHLVESSCAKLNQSPVCASLALWGTLAGRGSLSISTFTSTSTAFRRALMSAPRPGAGGLLNSTSNPFRHALRVATRSCSCS